MQKIIYNNTLKRVSVYIFIFLTIIHLLVISKQALKNSKRISRRKLLFTSKPILTFGIHFGLTRLFI